MSHDPFLKLLERAEPSDRIKVILCFDDGFAASSESTAVLFEKHDLSAVFAVLTEEWRLQGLGNWDLWNRLQDRGHFIHPHGPFHKPRSGEDRKKALGEMPFANSTAAIERCLSDFTANLKGFAAERACFHYPHNKGNPQLNEWLLKTVAAVRLAPDKEFRGKEFHGYNAPEQIENRVLYCTTYGHKSPLELVEKAIAAKPYAWIVALHGVDGEGWGPVTQGVLDTLLTRIAAEPSFDFLNRR